MLNYREDNKKRGWRLALDFAKSHAITLLITTVAFIVIVVSLFVLFSNRSHETAKYRKGVNYKNADTIYLRTGEIPDMNTLKNTNPDLKSINNLLYDSLFKVNENLNIYPSLVEDYTTDKDKGECKITIRKDAVFSDGSDVTVKDIRYSISVIKREGEDGVYFPYIDKIRYVDAEDDKNITVYFKSKDDAALDNLTFPIFKYGAKQGDDFFVGGGPYKLSNAVSGNKLKFEPNTEYKKGVARNKIELEIGKSSDMDIGLITMDALTAKMYRNSNVISMIKNRNVKSEKIVSPELEYVGFNCRKGKITSDKKIRKAIGNFIDKEEIIEDNYGGAAVSSKTLFFPNFLKNSAEKDKKADKNKGYQEKTKRKSESKKILSKLKNKKDSEGMFKDASGNLISLKILTREGFIPENDTAIYLVQMLKKLGFASEIIKVNPDEYNKKLKEGDFDIYIGSISTDERFNLSPLFDKDNYAGFSDKKTIEKVKSLETCLTAEEQKKAFSALQRELEEENVYVSLCYKTYSFIHVETLSKDIEPTFFDVFRGCNTWSWKKIVS